MSRYNFLDEKGLATFWKLIKTKHLDKIYDMIYTAHAQHSISISPTVIEIDPAETTINMTKLNFKFNGVDQTSSTGVSMATVYPIHMNSDTDVIDMTSNINTTVNKKLGSINSSVTVDPGYVIKYNGSMFTGKYSITAVHPIYCCASVSDLHDPIQNNVITGMTKSSLVQKYIVDYNGTKSLKTGASGTYTVTTNGNSQHIFIASPYDISTDNFFDDTTGFKFYMDKLATGTISGTGAGTNPTYHFYRSLALSPGTYKIRIK